MSQPIALSLSLSALVFDALGHGHQLEALGELDDGLAQPAIDLVVVAIADIAAVDLELAERQLPQPRQRRIAGAEIVQRQRAAQAAQLLGDVIGKLEVVQNLVLGDFEDEARPIRRRRPMLAQHPRQRQFDQRRDRHVDREFYRGAVHRAVLEVAQRRDDDALGQRQHFLFFGAGQEGTGSDDAAVRQPRPHQTLGADQTLGAQIDLRLIPELVPVAQQDVAQRQLAAARLGRGRLRVRTACAGSAAWHFTKPPAVVRRRCHCYGQVMADDVRRSR